MTTATIQLGDYVHAPAADGTWYAGVVVHMSADSLDVAGAVCSTRCSRLGAQHVDWRALDAETLRAWRHIRSLLMAGLYDVPRECSNHDP